jgi:hypothetical protein
LSEQNQALRHREHSISDSSELQFAVGASAGAAASAPLHAHAARQGAHRTPSPPASPARSGLPSRLEARA